MSNRDAEQGALDDSARRLYHAAIGSVVYGQHTWSEDATRDYQVLCAALERLRIAARTVGYHNVTWPTGCAGHNENANAELVRAALAHRESPVTSGERAALRIAARLVDDLNGEDIHGVAWEMCMKRLGVDEDFDADPNDDDYAAALVDICSRIPTEAP
jgi:hypothetical protein